VKAAAANSSDFGLNGIYSSTDSGHTFTKVYDAATDCSKNLISGNLPLSSTSCGDQGWYDLAFGIDPTDPNKVLVGGVNTYYSGDGGSSWDLAAQWFNYTSSVATVHADKHFYAYNPINPTTLYECSDGGIHCTTNPLSPIWTDLTNGLCITEFYRNAVSNVTNYAIGGAQDNGTKKTDNGVATELTGGDGMDCQMDPTDPNIMYTSSQNGYINISTDGGSTFSSISNNISSPAPQGAWITPFVIHPASTTMILAGYHNLYFSNDNGLSWSSISPSFGSFIERIALAYTNPQYIYLSIGGNSLQKSTNFGGTWTTIASPSSSFSDIIVDPKDETKLWATISGYNAAKKVGSYTPTGGWVFHNNMLPNVPIDCIAIDSSNGTMYIGTDVGVFYSTDTAATWQLFDNHMPTVHVTDLGINYTTNEIWAATYGRGMWKSVRYGAASGVSVIPYSPDMVQIAPNPNNGKFTITTTNKLLIGGAATIKLIDIKGNTVWHNATTFTSNGIADINAKGIAHGTYIVDIANSYGTIARATIIVL
jgi:photosystem II stability/assembly factor-like uncharacterized protein